VGLDIVVSYKDMCTLPPLTAVVVGSELLVVSCEYRVVYPHIVHVLHSTVQCSVAPPHLSPVITASSIGSTVQSVYYKYSI
jgi:hypothetical protein